MWQGKKRYRASTSVGLIDIRGRDRQSLEAVVQDHVLLSLIRENICVWFQEYGRALASNKLSECPKALSELRSVCDSVFSEAGVDKDDFCTYFSKVNMYSHIGRQLYVPGTCSIDVCIQHLQLLALASQSDWQELRAAYLSIYQHTEVRVTSRGRVTPKCVDSVAKRLDDLYDRFASRRAAVAQRREDRRCRLERHHLRLVTGGKVVLFSSCPF